MILGLFGFIIASVILLALTGIVVIIVEWFK